MTDSNKELLGNLKRILGFGSTGANKNVITDANGDLTIGDILTDEDIQEKVEEFANALAFAINSIRLNITADQDILSYADDDECTITATLTQAGAPLSNKAISLYKNDVLWDTLTTDSNGEVTKTYVSEGVGDIEIKAKYGSFLSETYELQDYWQILPSINPKGFITEQCPYPAEITGQVAKNGSWGGTRIRGYNDGQWTILYCFLSNNYGNAGEGEKIRYNVSSSYQGFKIVLKEDTATLYINDTLISSVNASATDSVAMDGGSTANAVSLTNIKLKRL